MLLELMSRIELFANLNWVVRELESS